MRRLSISTISSVRLAVERLGMGADWSWLVVLPVGVWAIATLYLPILGSFLSGLETGVVTGAIVLLSAMSLAGHILAHVYAARALGSETPPRVSLFLFGDAAQLWPVAATPWREMGVALAGPLANLLLGGLAYWIWNAQLNPLLNLSMLFGAAFNGWLVVINLTPAFPLDGGRLARAIVWEVTRQPALSARLGEWLGVLIAVALTGWGIFLIAQQTRFSWATGAVTIGFALLMLLGLRGRPAWAWDRPVPAASPHPLGALAAGLLLIGLLLPASSLVLTNDGIEAPGLALSVEPMVEVQAPHRYRHGGTFILTSVLSQTPIVGGEWLMSKLDPAVKLVPPVSVVPDNTSPQTVARQGFQMLDESETTAIVVGLRQAGYTVEMVGKGVQVVDLLPESPAQGQLQPGDVITGLNGNPITTTDGLINQVQALDPHATAQLQVERGQRQVTLAVPVIPPSSTNPHPRLGIQIESAGSEVKLPFPAKIVAQKIVGGPSAGLMFTLTVYNMLTPQDLTGGRKIAGTGTINLDGTVGPIGGVEQKVAAAEAVGATYFLSPPDNFAAALSVARHIKVVKVATVEQAIAFLRSLPPL
jgi:PDZ domain-containing protein